MPTLSSATPPTNEPHRQRQIAESFGSDAERYDRARPAYPEALIERIAAGNTTILNVGCGTGIEARQFRAAGCTVLGVEPDARMAEYARRDGTEVEVATFESWEPAGRRFDAVVAGTAWHWVDPVAGATKAADVLGPGGRIAPFWHVFGPPAEIAEAFAAAVREALPDSPFARLPTRVMQPGIDAYQPILTKAADGIRQADAFTEPEQWRYDWDREYSRDDWLDLLPTQGGLTRVGPDTLGQILGPVGAAIDALGGTITVHYTTAAVTATRT